MNEDIMRAVGFGDYVDKVKRRKCPSCGKTIDVATEFRDYLSKKEYTISGLCQKCQDEVFGR